MSWARYVAHTEELRNEYKILKGRDLCIDIKVTLKWTTGKCDASAWYTMDRRLGG
jgi:hypothetical protein